ncbi:uncharacterized protein BT62DRAFT_931005 [Guyanagaster necrorhizus]|uniref:Uncharacterized protein n=1 Tax=Guyanagaster necrorhizus TaxID=856835 RepID=A0A9P7VUM1_9AGAR|nr:uncharacterized protein BT62DRAFT_930982 [Guyanagaster necrorhizus MCA 3950]XP_043040667.1 uncharacterized protein BT62DRAFT_931005 [Guyanagaster necrorhizus MCA 3950]KAG7447143.1 hypothetical protein BT62DRAFT_930982 [Guyanagaster necrorhizus MCA 3950]KAG7447167.1 hypothetical protein BT62DRAFT_931005 [Guyanagaster necrorhizus MCA 3950]
MAERKASLHEFKDSAEEWLFRVCLPNTNSMYGFRVLRSASQHNVATSVIFSTDPIAVFDMDAFCRH